MIPATAINRPRWVRAYRVCFALLTIGMIAYQLHENQDKGVLNVANFFSYFTIQSNILAAVVLLVGGSSLRFVQWPTIGWEMIRGAALMYMATTGVVYGLLLADVDVQTNGLVNDVLHRIIPIVMVADFLLQPFRHRITYQQALVWTIYPLVYLAYSLIRGPIVDWYPYPFLNPDKSGGYPGVAAYSVGILVFFLVATWVILTVSEWRRAKRAPSPALPA